MPKWLEDKLRKQGQKKGLVGKDLENFIYGTMTNIKKGLKKKGKTWSTA
jgi:hypothetical protein